METFRLDDIEVTGITDIHAFDVPLTTLLPDADPAALAAIDWIGPDILSDGIVHLKIRSWLIRFAGKTILVDTCVGAGKERPLWQDWHQRDGAGWRRDLAAAGVRPEDVDVVFCTHLHADHVGWNTRLQNGRWVPTFPNARYLTGADEYAYWRDAPPGTDRHGSFADSVTPVMAAGLMELVHDGADLAGRFTLHRAPGHTPGHMVLKTPARGGAIFSGDAIHTPIQLARPEWSSAFCADVRNVTKDPTEPIGGSGGDRRLAVPCAFPRSWPDARLQAWESLRARLTILRRLADEMLEMPQPTRYPSRMDGQNVIEGAEAAKSLTEKAYLRIEEMIVTLRLAPGQVLSESDLIRDLGIGRTPVREALQRLAFEGLVVIMPRRGILVSEINHAKQLSLLELRREVERLIARSAALRATDIERRTFADLAENLGRAGDEGDDVAFMRFDLEFNRMIIATCRNEYAARTMQLIQGLARRFWYQHYQEALDLKRCALLHKAVAEAIASGDEEMAARASDDLIDYMAEFTRASI